MKRNKIMLVAVTVLLAVGTAFGANKMHHKKFTAIWYQLVTNGPCSSSSVSCGTNSDNPPCVSGAVAYYTAAGCPTADLTTTIVYEP